MKLTQKEVKRIFTYKDGKLYWNIKVSNVTVGSQAGYYPKSGSYAQVRINKHLYKLHRIVFLYHHGYVPEFVDHIDCNKTNNRIKNLRPATKQENFHNMGGNKNTTSKYKGVYYAPRNKRKWVAETRSLERKKVYLGCFLTEEEAAQAYDTYAKEHFGNFARLNFPVVLQE